MSLSKELYNLLLEKSTAIYKATKKTLDEYDMNRILTQNFLPIQVYATDICQELHYDNVKPVIAINGRGFYKSLHQKIKIMEKCPSKESFKRGVRAFDM